MTAPVQQQASQKIAMTAPVQQELSGNVWRVSFIMPAKYNLQNIPKPKDSRIKLKEIPKQKFIVIRFSGRSSDANIKKYQDKLIEYTTENRITLSGKPKYAFYNPPWTLPFLRRNEIMFEIRE